MNKKSEELLNMLLQLSRPYCDIEISEKPPTKDRVLLNLLSSIVNRLNYLEQHVAPHKPPVVKKKRKINLERLKATYDWDD